MTFRGKGGCHVLSDIVLVVQQSNGQSFLVKEMYVSNEKTLSRHGNLVEHWVRSIIGCMTLSLIIT